MITGPDDVNIDEPPPPGLEEWTTSLDIPLETKFRPSKLERHIPVIQKYITLALCRQRLHDEVLKEWKSSHITGILCKCFDSWGAMRNTKLNATGGNSEKMNLNNLLGVHFSCTLLTMCVCIMMFLFVFISALYHIM